MIRFSPNRINGPWAILNLSESLHRLRLRQFTKSRDVIWMNMLGMFDTESQVFSIWNIVKRAFILSLRFLGMRGTRLQWSKPENLLEFAFSETSETY